MMVQVPAGMSGGQTLQVQTPAGLMSVQIPPGLTAGQSFQMKVPLPPQQTQPAIAQPVHAQPQPTAHGGGLVEEARVHDGFSEPGQARQDRQLQARPLEGLQVGAADGCCSTAAATGRALAAKGRFGTADPQSESQEFGGRTKDTNRQMSRTRHRGWQDALGLLAWTKRCVILMESSIAYKLIYARL